MTWRQTKGSLELANVGDTLQPPTTLFIVHSSIDSEREEAFNHWYTTKHCPDVLKAPGAISARRYRRILGDDPQMYIAVYEFESEDALNRFLESPYRKELLAEHHALWDPFPDLTRGGYVEIWSSDRDSRR
jgi:antibiotic biosynthesis monooxygenase (ABM) superfamily enzyme